MYGYRRIQQVISSPSRVIQIDPRARIALRVNDDSEKFAQKNRVVFFDPAFVL